MSSPLPLRPRVLPDVLGVLIAVVLLAKLGPPSIGLPLAGALAVYALFGARQSVEALFLIALLILVGRVDLSLGRWLVMFAAAVRIVLPALPQRDLPPLIMPLALFGTVVFLMSLAASGAPVLSILKLIAFVVGVATVAVGLHRTAHLMRYWFSWLYTLGIFLVLGSAPFYFTSVGYSRNGVGFQGFLTHPQTFGPVLAPITALLMSLYLFQDRRSPLIGTCIVLGWTGMVLSQARTAIFATLLGMAVVLAAAVVTRPGWRASIRRAASRRISQIAAGVVVLLIYAQQTSLPDQVRTFLVKDAPTATVLESLRSSREGLAITSLENFRQAPLVGIGFGVPSDPRAWRAGRSAEPLGLPVEASVEKGFMATAVLEEIGLVGTALVIVLVGSLLGPAHRYRDPTLLWVMSTALLVNLGEMVFFSFGGMGFYLWIVMLVCHQHGRLARAPLTVPSPVAERRA